MTIHIIGGVYREICAWPERLHLLGSAGRAAQCITHLSREVEVVLHTKIAKKDEGELASLFAFSKCKLNIVFQKETTEFFYDHPLATPRISPDNLLGRDLPIYHEHGVDGEDVILFGMIDCVPSVKANVLIYDPQNARTPQLLSQMQSSGKQVIYVLNAGELSHFYSVHCGADKKSLEDKARWLLDHEQTECVVVKCGAQGAYVCVAKEGSGWVPAYESHTVDPIGSGDAFVAAFSYFRLTEGLSYLEAAKFASISTAFYVQNGQLTGREYLHEFAESLKEHKPTNVVKKVYLAGPFFSVSQMWLINEAKANLEAFGFDVFSPYHELGIGPAEIVAPKDAEAIDNADIIYAIFDGHDPGTLFEIGYAIKAKKPVMVFSEQSSDEHLKMYKGTGCEIEHDFTTSIYRLSWM
jgi:nucleoside 2-deoxyribosyltransferase